MHKMKYAGILLVLFLVVAGIAFFVSGGKRMSDNDSVRRAAFDPRNASYELEGRLVTLVDGEAHAEAAPGSASQVTTRYFGNEAEGDLNFDGKEDRAFLITQETGGTGIFYYAVVALKTADGYKMTNAFFIGDRIAPQTTEIRNDELLVNYAERQAGEPMTAQPSRGATKLLKVTQEGILTGLMQ